MKGLAAMADRMQEQREIKYRIGRRKGTISTGGTADKRTAPDRHRDEDVKLPWLWRPLPFVPLPLAAALFGLMPVLLFGAILWLVLQLKLLE